jgi:hypothetical protein
MGYGGTILIPRSPHGQNQIKIFVFSINNKSIGKTVLLQSKKINIITNYIFVFMDVRTPLESFANVNIFTSSFLKLA